MVRMAGFCLFIVSLLSCDPCTESALFGKEDDVMKIGGTTLSLEFKTKDLSDIFVSSGLYHHDSLRIFHKGNEIPMQMIFRENRYVFYNIPLLTDRDYQRVFEDTINRLYIIRYSSTFPSDSLELYMKASYLGECRDERLDYLLIEFNGAEVFNESDPDPRDVYSLVLFKDI